MEKKSMPSNKQNMLYWRDEQLFFSLVLNHEKKYQNLLEKFGNIYHPKELCGVRRRIDIYKNFFFLVLNHEKKYLYLFFRKRWLQWLHRCFVRAFDGYKSGYKCGYKVATYPKTQIIDKNSDTIQNFKKWVHPPP
jgi:hypothetical protein